MGRETVLLIDGHALVYRAFFAMPALTNSRGEVINAVYGFTSMLLKAFGEHRPDYAIACFDPPGPTFRHDADPTYKAQRPSMPDDLRPQVGWSREVIGALGIPSIELQGYEADDVIGTLSRRAEDAGLDVLILTGDIDALQLVTDHVSVYASRRGITDTIVYDIAKVRERFGFEPPLVADYKALQGDVSDNIPGVPGIGTKTAMALIQQHGGLEDILEAVPAMKESRVKRTLTENAEQARHSLGMTTIHCDVEVPFDLAQARLTDYDPAAARSLFARIEMPSLVARLPPPSVSRPDAARITAAQATRTEQSAMSFEAPARDAVDVRVLLRREDVEEAVERVRAGIAVRTVIVEPVRLGRLLGVAFAATADPDVAWYIPLGHAEGNAEDGAEAPLAAVLADPAVAKTGYDLKRDLVAWGTREVNVCGLDFDLMLGAYLTNTRQRVPSLTLLAHDLLGVQTDPEDTILGTGRNRRTLADLEVEETAALYGELAGLIGPVRVRLEEELGSAGARGLHDDLELPLVPIIAGMERRGIRVDIDRLSALSAELYTRVGELESQVQEVANRTFNLGSTQQLAAFLYDDLGLAAGRRTKTGRSTDADTLETLRDENPVVGLVLEWRQLTKLKGTYVDAIPLLVDRDNRVHTTFNQAVASTGRLSSVDPNLQNIPIRTVWGGRIRDCFIADPDHVLVSVDYSQIELRVLAHMTRDPALVEAFRRGEDIHTRTAAEVYSVEPPAVTPDMRRNAKVVNFGVVYGLSDFGLARDTGMSQEEARVFIEAYFARLPQVREYLETVRNHARQWGHVDTLFGRRRYLPDIRAANRQIRQAAERMAVNMPMQGAAADIMKKAMLRTDAALREAGLSATQLLQVHDELLLEVRGAELESLVPLVRQAMEGAAELVVPLDVDVKVGPTWNSLRPLPRPVAAA
ncbi:MAG: DNA polymerase I [Candidatus Dormibacteria bacterium]